ncbi:FtsW/RodA/SpoVE family cell cycle protein [Meiothermus sp. QL-1]|uniref:FtsW/RodA/SpoVE family cell cycle protein n=1 Tax=Meiothermus sp. QL-1 TaxID=2058095 RepID=UPI000E0C7F67|nr:FtsW/RodA/SpoVE family cell cycle protein [Meiothermus sp. QL-1]RDI96541.1 FtsW/RodA/SpoVE family cell cycle protein [Meiothermus sp. QL-1]
MDSILLLVQLLLFALSALGVAASDGMRGAREAHSLENLRNILLSLSLTLLVARLHPRWALWAARPLFFLALVLLGLNLVFGFGPSGERRFLDLPFVPFNLQPSELAKLAVPLYLAAFFHQKPADYPIIGPVMAIVLASGLILISPDLDTALFLLFLAGFLLLTIGVPARRLLAIMLSGGLVLLAFSGAFLERLQKARDRFESWQTYVSGRVNELSPELLRGPLYQITQAHKAIVNAGPLGQGLSARMPHIPESHNDFILASILWAGGWLAGAVLLLAWWLLLARGLQIAAHLEGAYSVLAVGLTLYLTLQAALNIAAVLGVIPIGGSPLPLVSVGGNAMLMAGVAMGLLHALAREAFKKEVRP